MLELPEVEPDGLVALEIKPHSLQKHLFFWHYGRQFSTAMKNAWDHRVFVDLFAGPGFGRLAGTQRMVKGSPLLMLDVPDRFDRYVFCEKDESALEALRARAERFNAGRSALHFIGGDVIQSAEQVHAAIPRGRRDFTVLAFCLADPFSVSNLSFETIRRITARRFVDLGVLIPTGMEIQRNIDGPLQEGDGLDRFLGTPQWRASWSAAKRRGVPARQWVLEFFGLRMRDELGFLYDGAGDQVKPVVLDGKVLYDLVLFSRHRRGLEFARDAKRGTDLQRDLFS